VPESDVVEFSGVDRAVIVILFGFAGCLSLLGFPGMVAVGVTGVRGLGSFG
jgi:hypothetical protein